MLLDPISLHGFMAFRHFLPPVFWKTLGQVQIRRTLDCENILKKYKRISKLLLTLF